ncbi:MAG: hypothetical protein AAF573_01655 [Bacteroidota bacterium]
MAKKNSNKDNLTKIKGIGPKIQSILNEADIMTYQDLANAKKADIEKILEEAGPRFNAHDPDTWMKQAKALAEATSTKEKETAKPKAKTSKTKKDKPTTSKAKKESEDKPLTQPSTSEEASKIGVGELDLPRFRKIMGELKDNVDDISRLTVRKYRKEAKRDADRLLKSMRRDLRRWTKLLERGELTTQDFEFLVASNVSSAKMSSLAQSGLAEIRIKAYRSSVFSMIIDTIFGLALAALAKKQK